MWVLLGTSLPKVNSMSLFWDAMPKNGRHQRAVQRKANIHDLVRVNEHLVMRTVT